MATAKTKSGNSYGTYGLYNAKFVRTVTPGTTVKQEDWSGKLPTNKKSGGSTKFKK